MKRTRGTLLVAFLLGAGATACGPVTPVNPTWKDDVRPLMVSRCIRCHDDPPGSDVNLSAGLKMLVPKNFDYATIEDLMASPDYNAARAAAIYVKTPGILFMPPPPAAPLDDWQIEILELWAASPR